MKTQLISAIKFANYFKVKLQIILVCCIYNLKCNRPFLFTYDFYYVRIILGSDKMEFMIEIIFETIFELGDNATKSSKTPYILKLILLSLFTISVLGVCAFIIFLGITCIQQNYTLIGIVCILFSISFLALAILKIIKRALLRK